MPKVSSKIDKKTNLFSHLSQRFTRLLAKHGNDENHSARSWKISNCRSLNNTLSSTLTEKSEKTVPCLASPADGLTSSQLNSHHCTPRHAAHFKNELATKLNLSHGGKHPPGGVSMLMPRKGIKGGLHQAGDSAHQPDVSGRPDADSSPIASTAPSNEAESVHSCALRRIDLSKQRRHRPPTRYSEACPHTTCPSSPSQRDLMDATTSEGPTHQKDLSVTELLCLPNEISSSSESLASPSTNLLLEEVQNQRSSSDPFDPTFAQPHPQTGLFEDLSSRILEDGTNTKTSEEDASKDLTDSLQICDASTELDYSSVDPASARMPDQCGTDNVTVDTKILTQFNDTFDSTTVVSPISEETMKPAEAEIIQSMPFVEVSSEQSQLRKRPVKVAQHLQVQESHSDIPTTEPHSPVPTVRASRVLDLKKLFESGSG